MTSAANSHNRVLIAFERVDNVHKYLKQRLNWVQNSFEGELKEGELEKMKLGLSKLIEKEKDPLSCTRRPARNGSKKEVLGTEKRSLATVL